jgi:hypothetical protein
MMRLNTRSPTMMAHHIKTSPLMAHLNEPIQSRFNCTRILSPRLAKLRNCAIANFNKGRKSTGCQGRMLVLWLFRWAEIEYEGLKVSFVSRAHQEIVVISTTSFSSVEPVDFVM